MKKTFLWIIFIFIINFAYSDTFQLKDGTTIIGRIISLNENIYTIDTPDGVIIIDKDDILSIITDTKKIVGTLDSTDDKIKRIETNYGFSFSLLPCIKSESFLVKVKNPESGLYYNNNEFGIGYYIIPFDINIIISFPFSFFYYPKDILGIGFKYSYGIDYTVGFYSYLNITNNIYFAAKIKNFNKRRNFLFELGLVSDIQFFLWQIQGLPDFQSSLNEILRQNLFIKYIFGPGVFIGGEFYTNKGFTTAIGFIFEALFFINPTCDVTYKYLYTGTYRPLLFQMTNYQLYFFKAGIEVRFTKFKNYKLK